jgi:iron complex transport system substrate-binding protein
LNTVAINTEGMSSRAIDAAATQQAHRGASLYHVEPDLLRAAQPDLILTQEVCDVCAVSRRDVDAAARALGYQPNVLSLNPLTLEQVLDDVVSVARALGAELRGQQLADALRVRVANVAAMAAPLERPRVFCMEWLDPPYCAGHWVPDMVHLAGGRDELASSGMYSRSLEWKEIFAYQPEVIVLIPCSLGLDQVAAEFRLLRHVPGWSELPAVRRGRVYAGNTHLFSRSGPRLVDGVEVLARMLHPEVMTAPLPPGLALKVSDDGQRLEPYV